MKDRLLAAAGVKGPKGSDGMLSRILAAAERGGFTSDDYQSLVQSAHEGGWPQDLGKWLSDAILADDYMATARCWKEARVQRRKKKRGGNEPPKPPTAGDLLNDPALAAVGTTLDGKSGMAGLLRQSVVDNAVSTHLERLLDRHGEGELTLFTPTLEVKVKRHGLSPQDLVEHVRKLAEAEAAKQPPDSAEDAQCP